MTNENKKKNQLWAKLPETQSTKCQENYNVEEQKTMPFSVNLKKKGEKQ